ncbi:hypothetical protein pb186bvf_014110 [Paramecium bursaria]
MEENFKDASLNTYLLLKEAQNISEQYYKQGQLETLNKIIEELYKQEREGFKTSSEMVDLDYNYHKFQIGEKELISELFGHAYKSAQKMIMNLKQRFNIIKNLMSRTPIPTFILKTYQMLEVLFQILKIFQDPAVQTIVSWTAQGTAFIVYNQSQLAKQVLQNYFKHSNYSSFVRQLNLYNFKKSRTNEGQIFKHKCFRKGMKSLLQFIKRRNQEEQITVLQDEPTLQVKEEQNLFKECALDIKETNNKLREDMKLLQETSSYLIDQMQNLNQFVYNQSVDIEVKFKQVGQMLHAINDELRQEEKTDTTSTKLDDHTSLQFYPKQEDFYQESKIGSPNPYAGDYPPINDEDYKTFMTSFE